MKKKIRNVFVTIIFILVALIMLYVLTNETSDFEKKMNLLEKEYKSNEEVLQIDESDKIVIIAISDRKEKAIVRSQKASTVDNAYQKLKKEVNLYINEKKFGFEWIKLDIVNEIEEKSYSDFCKDVESINNDNTYRKGLILNDGTEEFIFSEAELNSNCIVDYENNELNINNINKYLNEQGKNELRKIPSEVKIFTTISFFCDETSKTYELYNNGANTGRRKQDIIDKNEIYSIIANSSNYLSNMLQSSGKFIYGYNPLKNKELTSYNILRHCGSVWSLIVCFDENTKNKESLKANINNATEYMISQIREQDKNISYIIEEKTDEIKLGGNALAVIAMCEYTEKFQDSKYIELLKKLANGIINMQEDGGNYIHVLNASDFSKKEDYRTVYYDGEATFALIKLYGITNDEKYLNSAKKAMDYFVENNYTKYCDHWLSYASNEITKYIDNEKYYEFGIKNITENADIIRHKQFTSHVNFEMLIKGYELYNRLIEKKISFKDLDQFSIKDLKMLIDERAKFQLNSYMYPEFAMYLSNPNEYYNVFFIRQNNFRIRIDDIQHSLLGYKYYINNFDKI